ncbi:Hypothetical protein FKW44_000785, partial [Caligus rogercresseyi]
CDEKSLLLEEYPIISLYRTIRQINDILDDTKHLSTLFEAKTTFRITLYSLREDSQYRAMTGN